MGKRRYASPLRTGLKMAGEIKFLTIAEVANLMRVSKMTVYRMVHNGELVAVRFGRSFRIPEEEVNRILQHSFYDAG
jgi:excisionase family DNA binding protein